MQVHTHHCTHSFPWHGLHPPRFCPICGAPLYPPMCPYHPPHPPYPNHPFPQPGERIPFGDPTPTARPPYYVRPENIC